MKDKEEVFEAILYGVTMMGREHHTISVGSKNVTRLGRYTSGMLRFEIPCEVGPERFNQWIYDAMTSGKFRITLVSSEEGVLEDEKD